MHEAGRHALLARGGLTRETLRNPLVCICNYVFDTLRQDAFKIVDGQLFEALATLYGPQVSGEGGAADGGGGGGGRRGIGPALERQ